MIFRYINLKLKFFVVYDGILRGKLNPKRDKFSLKDL